MSTYQIRTWKQASPSRGALRYGRLLAALLFAAACAVSAEPAYDSDVELTAVASRSEVALDETVDFSIVVTWSGGADAYRFTWPETPQTYRLDVVGSRRSSSSWADDTGERSRQTFSYVLKPTEIGRGSVGAVALTYWTRGDSSATSRSLMSAPVTIEVLPAAHLNRGMGWPTIAGLAIFGLLIAGFAWWALRKKDGHRHDTERDAAENRRPHGATRRHGRSPAGERRPRLLPCRTRCSQEHRRGRFRRKLRGPFP